MRAHHYTEGKVMGDTELHAVPDAVVVVVERTPWYERKWRFTPLALLQLLPKKWGENPQLVVFFLVGCCVVHAVDDAQTQPFWLGPVHYLSMILSELWTAACHLMLAGALLCGIGAIGGIALAIPTFAEVAFQMTASAAVRRWREWRRNGGRPTLKWRIDVGDIGEDEDGVYVIVRSELTTITGPQGDPETFEWEERIPEPFASKARQARRDGNAIVVEFLRETDDYEVAGVEIA
jgi:hypothetical protein